MRTQDAGKKGVIEDRAFMNVLKLVIADKSRFCNSIELYNLYTSNNDNVGMGRKTFIVKLLSELGGSFISFHNRGASTLYCFNDHARVVLKDAKDKNDISEECQEEDVLCSIGSKIKEETKRNKIDKSSYNSYIDLETAMESTSDTYISPKFRNSLYGALIGNIVTSIVQDCSTPLMLALGNLLRTSKILLNHFYDYRVTCTHGEILRFKRSAAANSANAAYLQGVPGNNDLLQVITDNYDAIMHSHNNKLLCHCLANILTRNGDRPSSGIKFLRSKKIDMPKSIDEANSVEISTYIGPKKPPMPAYVRKSLSEDFIRRQTVSREGGENIDFQFFVDISVSRECPEYNGYCTRLTREQGQRLRPKTQTIYLPLLDMIPANPTTVQTSIKHAKLLSTRHGQSFCVYTSDQQLYRIATIVLWNTPDLGRDLYLRLGGMHLLMSFVGSIGSLMAGSGLKEVLEKGFDGVPKC